MTTNSAMIAANSAAVFTEGATMDRIQTTSTVEPIYWFSGAGGTIARGSPPTAPATGARGCRSGAGPMASVHGPGRRARRSPARSGSPAGAEHGPSGSGCPGRRPRLCASEPAP